MNSTQLLAEEDASRDEFSQIRNDRRHEVQLVKAALKAAGITVLRVSHGRGTAWGWLDVKAVQRPGQAGSNATSAEVLTIVQKVTGRHGAYDGRISVHIERRDDPFAAEVSA